MPAPRHGMLDVNEAGRALGVSRSTIWRMIRRGALPSVRKNGRRFIPTRAVEPGRSLVRSARIPPLREDHPIFKFVGTGHSGGAGPGARDKHAIVDVPRR